MSRLRVLLVPLLGVLAAAPVLAAPAWATVRTADLTDTVGDNPSGQPDLLGLRTSFDDAGAFSATFTFAATPAPTADTLFALFLGRFSGSTCQAVFQAGGLGDASQGTWGRSGAAGTPLNPTRDGTTLTLAVSSPDLADPSIDCVYAGTRSIAGQANGDGIGAADLVAPAPTTPPPTPTPTPTPSPQPTPAEPVPPAPTATQLERYDAAVARCPKRTSKARSRCLASARKRYAKGAALAAKRRRNPLIGRVYLHPGVDVANVCGGTCLEGFAFTDDRYVFRGVAEQGPAVVRCTKVTAVGDKDGCLRYTLGKDRRSFTIAGTRYRLTADRRQFAATAAKGVVFTRVAVPVAGARYDASLQTISSFGLPGNQVFSTGQLALARDGRFVTARQVSGTTGGGSDVETNFTTLGADRKGTYAFEPGGTLALRFADGTVRRRSAVVAFGPKASLGIPSRDGLILDGAIYLPQDD